jgi:hypothetical protein
MITTRLPVQCAWSQDWGGGGGGGGVIIMMVKGGGGVVMELSG